MKKAKKVISFILAFILIATNVVTADSIIQASTAGTAVYGSGSSNGSVQDTGWIITMEKVPNEYAKKEYLGFENAETATMDLYRNQYSYLDNTSPVWFEGMSKNSILIVDKSSYPTNLKHWYCNGIDKNGANSNFNSKVKVYDNSKGSGGPYTFEGYLLSAMQSAVTKSKAALTYKEWEKIYKENKTKVASGAERFLRNFNSFGNLSSNFETYISAGKNASEPEKDTTYLRYLDILSVVNHLSGDKYNSLIKEYLENLSKGNEREYFIELFIIPVIATTGSSSNDRLWYNAASWYSFIFQTDSSKFTKTAVKDEIGYLLSMFSTGGSTLKMYRETDIKGWYTKLNNVTSSFPTSLTNNSSIWSKYVISGRGNLTEFSDERNLRYTALAVSQAKASIGKALNSNSGYTFLSAGKLITPIKPLLNPCGGISATVIKPKDGIGTIDDFTKDHLEEVVSNHLSVSFLVEDEAAKKTFYE